MCNFYQYLHTTLIVLTLFLYSTALQNHNLKISSSGVDNLSPKSIGIIFYALLNNTSKSKVFQVDLVPEICCLDSGDQFRDCKSMELAGLHLDSIPAATVVNTKLIAPLISPFNRKGYCIVNVDSKNVERRGKSMRQPFRINFDTSFDNFASEFYCKVDLIAKCKNADEDPLANCEPVDCDVHYNGKKPFFNRKLRHCTQTPVCLPTDHMDDEIIYDPRSNLCQKTLLNDDLKFIKSLQEENATSTTIVDRKMDIEGQIPSYSQELELIELNNKFFTWAFAGNKNIAILSSIILLQFFALLFICCRYTKTYRSSKGQNNDKLKSIYHYQQKASDTTPLIGMSNTETTDYINQSFPSNTALQVKSYKSIQEFNDDSIKKAVSDDILTKCLNRRTWKRSSPKETPGYESARIIEDLVEKLTDCSSGSSKLYEPQYKQDAKSRVRYMNETEAKNVTIYDNDDEYHDVTKGQESEEEIKCHSYWGDKSSTKSTLNNEEASHNTVFTQNSAQIDFSSDTIDRLLEKHNVFTAPIDMSQYSCPDTKTAASSRSSGTVRDRIKARWSKLFPKKSKSCPSSDPGTENSDKLELLHMSRISIHSSTANETE